MKCYQRTSCHSFLVHNGYRRCNTHLKMRGAREHYSFDCKMQFHHQMGENPTQCPFKDVVLTFLTSVYLFAEKISSLKRKADDVTSDSKLDLKKPFPCPCPHCKAVLSAPTNLRHIRDAHNFDTTPMICIDARSGLYVTPKYDHSPVFPIHVLKSTNPPNIDCEVENCCRCMQISSGNPGKECVHLERTKNAKSYVKPAVLQCNSLKDMLSKGLMSSKCEQFNNTANNRGVESVFPVFFGDEGYPNRCVRDQAVKE